MDMAGVNHGGNNHHGSRLNSLEQPVLNGKPQEHKDSLQDEEVDEVDDVDGEGVYGALLGPAQKRRQRSIRSVFMTISFHYLLFIKFLCKKNCPKNFSSLKHKNVTDREILRKILGRLKKMKIF